MWEDFVVFVLGSAFYQALRLSIGLSFGLPGLSVRTVVTRCKDETNYSQYDLIHELLQYEIKL